MIHWFAADDCETPFPDVERALKEPDGLLAAGGNLKPARLLEAYRQGIFPWYSEGEPILWWSPLKRAVIFPESIHISRSLRKTLRQRTFRVTRDAAFRKVMLGCAAPRRDNKGTWITPEMIAAYCNLFKLGYAHSIECWLNDRLVGGLYGIQLGQVFFGESMFSQETDASKVALVTLARQGNVTLIDCQLPNDHLARMGMTLIPRREFIELLNYWCPPASVVQKPIEKRNELRSP
jgi:leucyl/phenylalanyl-tRNA--protein transferase